MSFASLFPDAEYRHHLSVKRGGLVPFFAATPAHDEIIAERAQLLAQSPQLYAAAPDAASDLIEEAARAIAPDASLPAAADSLRTVIALGAQIEPDLVLLKKGDGNIFRVVAGCVCFPSSWSFPEKMGMTLPEIHAVVPELNASIGPAIHRFLDKMQPGASWERSNWGLSASPARNQHPARGIARLAPPLSAGEVWLRVEDQILTVLPQTRGLLFGIRIVSQTLAELCAHEPRAGSGLLRALTTMSEDMACYKNIGHVRADLVRLLEAQNLPA